MLDAKILAKTCQFSTKLWSSVRANRSGQPQYIKPRLQSPDNGRRRYRVERREHGLFIRKRTYQWLIERPNTPFQMSEVNMDLTASNFF